MCDCLPSTTSVFSVVKFRPLRFSFSTWEPKSRAFSCLSTSNCRNGPNSDYMGIKPNTTLAGAVCAVRSRKGGFDDDFGLEEEGANRLAFESSKGDSSLESLDAGFNKLNGFSPTKAKMTNDRRLYDDAAESPSLDFLELKDDLKDEKRSGNGGEGLDEEINMVPLEDTDSLAKESGRYNGEVGFRRRKQVMRRSSILAKQVISIQSARSMGFVSQIWVDTAAWMVIFLEVKPNLLSGESEWFLLEDVSQVGDVVLVQDETVVDNEFKMIGLETLVGYKVVTPGLRSIGKIRGYTFNINSGAVESLELDSFGISIIPSTLVSTYSLLVEDVLEVVSDSVVVDEAAASRIQRLSKGFLGTQNVGKAREVELREYGDGLSDRRWSKRRSSGRQKYGGRRETYDDWDHPKDYM